MLNLIDKPPQIENDIPLNIKSGNPVSINEAYRRLKLAGWMPTGKLHPAENVPVFVLHTAYIWRDTKAVHDWIVQYGDGSMFGYDGDILTFTEDVKRQINLQKGGNKND